MTIAKFESCIATQNYRAEKTLACGWVLLVWNNFTSEGSRAVWSLKAKTRPLSDKLTLHLTASFTILIAWFHCCSMFQVNIYSPGWYHPKFSSTPKWKDFADDIFFSVLWDFMFVNVLVQGLCRIILSFSNIIQRSVMYRICRNSSSGSLIFKRQNWGGPYSPPPPLKIMFLGGHYFGGGYSFGKYGMWSINGGNVIVKGGGRLIDQQGQEGDREKILFYPVMLSHFSPAPVKQIGRYESNKPIKSKVITKV